MGFVPTVLYPLDLPGLLDHVLTAWPATTAATAAADATDTPAAAAITRLVVCSSRLAFLHHLSASLEQPHHGCDPHGLEHFTVPLLHSLLTTRQVQVAFCASVPALLAYLTAYGQPGSRLASAVAADERLVLVNPLALHAPTPAFSAQGLSRTFATAVELTLRTGVKTYIVECEGMRETLDMHEEETEAHEEQQQQYHQRLAEQSTNLEHRHHHGDEEADEQDPWEQHVPILNVSARRFGSGAGERAWAGRTVKAKRVAARWFRFHKLHSDQMHPPASG